MAIRPGSTFDPSSMQPIKARPTVYKGIQMRSRLEADFAQRVLDAGPYRNVWSYEPACFADDEGQYLPDFGIRLKDGRAGYIELKPLGPFSGHDQVSKVDAVLRRMTAVWALGNEPGALLCFMAYDYGTSAVAALRIEAVRDSTWWVSPAGTDRGYLWPGMGQHEKLAGADAVLRERDSLRRLVPHPRRSVVPKGKGTREQRLRRKYPSAGRRWTKDEQIQLLVEFERGDSIDDIAMAHGRQPSAIRSRLDNPAFWKVTGVVQ